MSKEKSKEIVKVEKQSLVYLDYAKALKVKKSNLMEASKIAKEVVTAKKKLKAHYRGFITPAYDVYKGFLNDEKVALKPFQEVESILRIKIEDFNRAEEKRLYELEQKAIRQAEEKERKRIKELEKQAKKWEEKGNIEKAEERREIAENHFEPVRMVETKIKNDIVGSYKVLNIEVTSKAVFFQAVMQGRIENGMDYIKIDESAIKNLIRRDGLEELPGVKIIWEKRSRI